MLQSAKCVKELVIAVLVAYHMREADRIEAILNEAGTKSQWQDLWPKFLEASENPEAALCHYTQFIMAQLDGGDYTLPEGLTLE